MSNASLQATDARRRRTGTFKRTYLCLECGLLRRSAAHYTPGAPTAPRHCNAEMACLSYEQTVAATQLSPTERVRWMSHGGQVRKAAGKRQWRPYAA